MPKVSFSLPGITTANLARQLAHFLTPHVAELALVATPVLLESSLVSALTSVKRGAEMTLVTLGKKGRGEGVVKQSVMIPYELPFTPKMSLEHSGGTLTVTKEGWSSKRLDE